MRRKLLMYQGWIQDLCWGVGGWGDGRHIGGKDGVCFSNEQGGLGMCCPVRPGKKASASFSFFCTLKTKKPVHVFICSNRANCS